MAETESKTKPDKLEDNSSSGEWTFVEKTINLKETNDSVEEDVKKKDLNVSETTAGDEEKSGKTDEQNKEVQEPKKEDDVDEEQIEKGDETNEKDGTESDDVSVITDEEPELVPYQEKRIEKLEKVEGHQQLCCSQFIAVCDSLGAKNLIRLMAACVVISGLIFVTFSGMIMFKLGSVNNVESQYQCAFETLGKLNPLLEMQDNLKNIGDVERCYDKSSDNSVPGLKILVDNLSKSVQNIMDYKKNIARSDKKFDHKIEVVKDLYEKICTIYDEMNPDSASKQKCKVPEALEEMVSFVQTYDKASNDLLKKLPETSQEEFLEDKREIDAVAESLLAELADASRKFTTQIEEMKQMDDNFKMRLKLLTNGNKNRKNEKEEKSKGEVKNGWKKNKFEKKDKQSSEEKKLDKREKYDKEYKKNNKNSKQKRENDDSRESGEWDYDRKYENKNRNGDYGENKNDFEKKNRDFDRQSYKKKSNEYNEKKDRDEYKNKKNKKEYNYERKFDSIKQLPDHDNKSDYEKFYDEQEFEYNKKKDKLYQEQSHKKYCESGHKCDKRYHDDDDDDDDDDDYPQPRPQPQPPHYVDKKDHQKKKYMRFEETPDKYFSQEYGDKVREKRSGEWLMERGSDREKQRNSDWYSARADSRQWARTEEEPRSSNSKPQHHYHHPKKYRPWSLKNVLNKINFY